MPSELRSEPPHLTSLDLTATKRPQSTYEYTRNITQLKGVTTIAPEFQSTVQISLTNKSQQANPSEVRSEPPHLTSLQSASLTATKRPQSTYEYTRNITQLKGVTTIAPGFQSTFLNPFKTTLIIKSSIETRYQKKKNFQKNIKHSSKVLNNLFNSENPNASLLTYSTTKRVNIAPLETDSSVYPKVNSANVTLFLRNDLINKIESKKNLFMSDNNSEKVANSIIQNELKQQDLLKNLRQQLSAKIAKLKQLLGTKNRS